MERAGSKGKSTKSEAGPELDRYAEIGTPGRTHERSENFWRRTKKMLYGKVIGATYVKHGKKGGSLTMRWGMKRGQRALLLKTGIGNRAGVVTRVCALCSTKSILSIALTRFGDLQNGGSGCEAVMERIG